MTKILKTLLIGAAALAAPVSVAAQPNDTPDMQLQKLLEGRVAGKPVTCISLSNTRESTIINGKAIVYRVGGKLFVNVPRGGAERLDDDDILLTRSFGSQLCRNDPVHLVDRVARFQRGFVQLGDFVPYSKPEKAR